MYYFLILLMWFVYVLQSEVAPRRYIGITTDLQKRLASHNRGATKSTKAWVPWKLVYSETYVCKREAAEKEKFLKSGVGREYLDSILRN